MKNQIIKAIYTTVLVSAVVYSFYMISGCVAGNETMARLGTIEKNNVTISGQVEDLNLRTNNIEQQLTNNITADNIGQVLSKNQKGVFAIGDGGAIWVLGALVAVLAFFGYMIKLLLSRRNLGRMLHDLTDSVYRSPKEVRERIRMEMREKKTKEQMKKFVETKGVHAKKGLFKDADL
jgi:outer membrane murein-binding lipoprotein Lpp